MKRFAHGLAVSAWLAVAASGAVQAKTFELPDGKPLVTIDLPNAWSPEEIEKGVQATAPDTSVYVAFEVHGLNSTDKAVAEAIRFFAKNGVKLDQSSQRKLETKINGIDVIDLNWNGTDNDGPTKVSLSILILSPSRIGILSYWGSPAGETKYAHQLKAIAESIQPLGR